MNHWTLIDHDFREKLPTKDCKIWITRVGYTGERWVQKVDYFVEDQDIGWDGTIAFMVAGENDRKPSPYVEKYKMLIQQAR